MTPPAKQNDNTGWAIAFCVVAGFIVLLSIGRCSPMTPVNTTRPFASTDLQNTIEAIEPAAAIEPLRSASVNRGIEHARVVIKAEGFSGAMIYSQNCYDSLGHDFSWSKLDLCGAFDLLIARSISEADADTLLTEASYFQPETAATRYLTAATEAGEEAGKADVRLADLQRKVAQSRRAVPRTSTNATDNDGDDTPSAGDNFTLNSVEDIEGEVGEGG